MEPSLVVDDLNLSRSVASPLGRLPERLGTRSAPENDVVALVNSAVRGRGDQRTRRQIDVPGSRTKPSEEGKPTSMRKPTAERLDGAKRHEDVDARRHTARQRRLGDNRTIETALLSARSGPTISPADCHELGVAAVHRQPDV
jgi:hypothetical protein